MNKRARNRCYGPWISANSGRSVARVLQPEYSAGGFGGKGQLSSLFTDRFFCSDGVEAGQKALFQTSILMLA